MKPRFTDFFVLRDRERNGTMILLVMITGVIISIFLFRFWIHPPEQDFSGFEQFVDSLQKTARTDSSANDDRPEGMLSVAQELTRHSDFQKKELFVFDPNGLPEKDWVRLGLSPAQAKSVKNYEAKGGHFEVKEDVKKLFVISASLYAELEPFIALPDASMQKKNLPQQEQRPSAPRIIELNMADSSSLLAVDGIGPAFAHRIIVYRERLGGFYSVNQLTEVYGIDEDRFEQIRDGVKADSLWIHKININTATVSDLRRHPYFSPAVANALVNYRKQHGPFRSVADIRGCNLVNGDLYRKIAPYLTI